jgi:hypothetical protein
VREKFGTFAEGKFSLGIYVSDDFHYEIMFSAVFCRLGEFGNGGDKHISFFGAIRSI